MARLTGHVKGLAAPIMPSHGPPSDKASVDEQPGAGHGVPVLFACGDVALRRALTLLLEVEGYRVHVADSVAALRAALLACGGECRCIVIDDGILPRSNRPRRLSDCLEDFGAETRAVILIGAVGGSERRRGGAAEVACTTVMLADPLLPDTLLSALAALVRPSGAG